MVSSFNLWFNHKCFEIYFAWFFCTHSPIEGILNPWDFLNTNIFNPNNHVVVSNLWLRLTHVCIYSSRDDKVSCNSVIRCAEKKKSEEINMFLATRGQRSSFTFSQTAEYAEKLYNNAVTELIWLWRTKGNLFLFVQTNNR